MRVAVVVVACVAVVLSLALPGEAVPVRPRASAAECPDGPVIIIGAGMSGLAAAETLGSFGCAYVVVEASGYVGGRTLSLRSGPFAGEDVGAHWIHGGAMNPITSKLVKAYGLKVVRVGGDEIYEGVDVDVHDVDGAAINRTAFDHSFDIVATESAALRQLQADREANHLPDISVQEGLDAITNKTNHTAFDERLLGWQRSELYEGDQAVSPWELGLRALMDDDYETFYTGKVWDRGTSGDEIIVGGYSTLVDAFVAANNITVTLNTQATQVSLVGDKVVVATSAGVFEGAAVIVTVPANMLQHSSITFSPPLDSDLTQAFTQVSQGSYSKVMLKFNDTFWNKTAYAEGFMSGDLKHYGYYPWSISSIHETNEGNNTLVCYIGGDMSLELNTQTDSEIVAGFVRVLESMYPAAKPITPVASYVARWDSHPFIRGAWSHVNVGGSGQIMKFMGKPRWNNRLAFAGEHTCYLFLGTVHGALVSGTRAAAAVMGASSASATTNMGPREGAVEGDSMLWEFRDRCEERPAGVRVARRG